MRTGIYGSLIGLLFLLIIWAISLTIAGIIEREKVEDTYVWNEDLCIQTELAAPGGFYYHIAEVCYVPGQGWHESNTARLMGDDYRKLILPLYMGVREIARSQHKYNEDDNVFMYRRFIEKGRDRYADR